MKRLYLLRHAKAVPAAEPLADIARPLAERGERDARIIGERLRQRRMRPDLILTSPAARTTQTARLVAAALDYPRDAIANDGRLYLAEPAALLAAIRSQAESTSSLMIVGHNPGLSELVLELDPSFDVDDLPTCAIVALDYADGAVWADVETLTGRLAYYDYPKKPSDPVTAR